MWLGTVLSSAMATSTFALAVYAILASELLAAFSAERWQIGALVTATMFAGAAASPSMGQLADRIGARRMVVTTLVGSGLALLAIAVSATYWMLVVAAIASGVMQATANPGTNKLIAERIPGGSRGIITGIKQSGVRAGSVVGGLSLPALEAAFGWQWAVAVFAFISVGLGLVAHQTLGADPTSMSEASSKAPTKPVPSFVKRLAGYGFLLGLGGAALITYLPLYAQEELGYSTASAGVLAAVGATVGVVSRIGAGYVSERSGRDLPMLFAMAVLAVIATGLFIAAPHLPLLIWLGAAVVGMSVTAWNSVGMLAVIQGVPSETAGRSSGVVLFGFLFGWGAGAPIMGWTVDRLGTYLPGWIGVAVVFVVAAALTVVSRPAFAARETFAR